MPDATENVSETDPQPPKPDPELTLETLQKFIAAQIGGLTGKFDQLDTTVKNLTGSFDQLDTTVKNFTGGFDKLERTVENLALDVGMMKERERRIARVQPHSDPVRAQTETGGDGFASYTWERKPATPRPS